MHYYYVNLKYIFDKTEVYLVDACLVLHFEDFEDDFQQKVLVFQLL